MTSTIRCLVLVSACSLWSACQDAQPAPAKPKAAQALLATPKSMALEPPAQLLSATAPEPIKSVADLPPKPVQETGADKLEVAHETPEPSFDRALSAGDVKVERFVLARDVKGREPVDVTDNFAEGTKKIFAFVQLANAGEPYAFRVHWEPVEGPSSPYGVELSVPTAERHRTWSWTAIERKPGRYRAVLRTLEGEEIASRELMITAASGDLE